MIDVKAFREERGITAKECVRVIKAQYAGYDKALHSKVENTSKYGVCLIDDAEHVLEEAFCKTAVNLPRRDNRRLKFRIQCRLSKTNYERLQQAFNRDGYITIQEGMSELIKRYIREGESNGN